MKLEYLADVNLYEPGDALIRLFDFDSKEAKMLQEIIGERIVNCKDEIDLTSLDFIQPVNCNLKMILGDQKGIYRISDKEFCCELTEESYIKMVDLIQPFVEENSDGYQWLYDVYSERSDIEFLLSPGGGW